MARKKSHPQKISQQSSTPHSRVFRNSAHGSNSHSITNLPLQGPGKLILFQVTDTKLLLHSSGGKGSSQRQSRGDTKWCKPTLLSQTGTNTAFLLPTSSSPPLTGSEPPCKGLRAPLGAECQLSLPFCLGHRTQLGDLPSPGPAAHSAGKALCPSWEHFWGRTAGFQLCRIPGMGGTHSQELRCCLDVWNTSVTIQAQSQALGGCKGTPLLHLPTFRLCQTHTVWGKVSHTHPRGEERLTAFCALLHQGLLQP